jgi:hypothetical protein
LKCAVHTLATCASVIINLALGLLPVGIFFKKIKKACHKWPANVLVACSSCVRISHQRKSPLSALLYLALWFSPVVGSGNPIATNYKCPSLDGKFSVLFLKALDEIEARISGEVDDAVDEIGLGPFGTSVIVGEDIYNFKADLIEKLFGTSGERATWIDGTATSSIDIPARLNANIANIIGIGGMNVTCVLSDDTESYMVDLIVHGSIQSADFIDPQITLLPLESFPPLGLVDFTIDIRYLLKLPFTLYHGINKIVHLGETEAKLSVQLDASISELLPILFNESINFFGDLKLNASFAYSSIHGFSPFGNFDVELSAVIEDHGGAGLKAKDDNIFDDNPRE